MNVKFKASARTTALHRTGAGRQRNPTAPVGGEVFSLDIPFHRTHETQNIRLVFWGLQRKHEEYREVGVGLALPLTLFQVKEGKTWVAHTCRFVACVRPFLLLECPRAWSPSSHTSQ